MGIYYRLECSRFWKGLHGSSWLQSIGGERRRLHSGLENWHGVCSDLLSRLHGVGLGTSRVESETDYLKVW